MKRPMLLFGIISTFSAVLFLLTGITAAIGCAVLGVSVLLLFLVFRKKFGNKILVPFICIALIICGLDFSLFQYFNVESVKPLALGKHKVTAYVCEIPTITENYTVYEFKTKETDGEKSSHKMVYKDYSGEADYSLYDNVVFYGAEFYKAEDINKSYLSEKEFLSLKSFDSAKILFKENEDLIYRILKFKESCINIIKENLPSEEAGLLSGMIFGDKSFLDENVYTSFGNAGVAHLLAVSGLHTSLWCGILFAILNLFGVKEKAKSIISLIFLFLLCVVSAFSPSVVRASFMTALMLLSPFFRRQPDGLNSLGFAISIMIICNPYILYSVGFELSAVATFGVIISGVFRYSEGSVLRRKHRILYKIKDYFKSNILVSVFAAVFTLPICSYYFKTFSIIAPVSNILCIKLAFVSMVSGLFSVLLSFVPFGIGTFWANIGFKISEILLWLLIKITTFLSEVPYSCVQATSVTVICVTASALLFALIFVIGKRKVLNKPIKIIASAVCVALFCCSCFSSIVNLPFNDEFTVISDSGTPIIALRSGKSFSLIGVPYYSSTYYAVKDFLPLTKEQSVENLVLVSDYNSKNENLKSITDEYSPKKVYTPIWCYDNYINSVLYESTNLKENTGEITFNGKIKLQTVDNYLEKYVIIKNDNKKFVFSVSGYNENNASEYLNEKPNVIVIGKYETEDFCKFCETLVVCADDNLDGKTENKLKSHCNKLIVLCDTESKTFSLN